MERGRGSGLEVVAGGGGVGGVMLGWRGGGGCVAVLFEGRFLGKRGGGSALSILLLL